MKVFRKFPLPDALFLPVHLLRPAGLPSRALLIKAQFYPFCQGAPGLKHCPPLLAAYPQVFSVITILFIKIFIYHIIHS